MADRRRASLVLAGVCLGWGTIPLVAAETALPPPAIVAGRVWIGAAGLGLLIALGRAPGARLLSFRPWRVVATGAVLAAHWTAMFAAYDHAPAANVIFVIFLAPVGIAALAPRTLGERPGARTFAALAIALAGFVLVAGPTAEDTGLAGLLFAAFAGATLVWLVLNSTPLAAAYGGLRLSFQQMTVAGVAAAPVALAADWGSPHAGWLWLVVLGLVHSALGTAIYLGALARVGATRTGILGYLEPAGVVLFAWVLAGDRPTPATLAGGLLIAVAGALVVSSTDRPVSPEVPADVPVG